ncbi:hypothetical protein EYA84_00030 [Verrucosispora sp. SN26_14.1]|nr:hypothetical protein EYA84_00030 [Verrucosispora sp. SN26_14.1]
MMVVGAVLLGFLAGLFAFRVKSRWCPRCGESTDAMRQAAGSSSIRVPSGSAVVQWDGHRRALHLCLHRRRHHHVRRARRPLWSGRRSAARRFAGGRRDDRCQGTDQAEHPDQGDATLSSHVQVSCRRRGWSTGYGHGAVGHGRAGDASGSFAVRRDGPTSMTTSPVRRRQ